MASSIPDTLSAQASQYQIITSSSSSSRTIGGKAEGLIKLKEIIENTSATPLPVRVPTFITISHEEIIEFLRSSSSEGLVDLLHEEYRLLLEDVENRALDRATDRVTRLKMILTEHLKDFPVKDLSIDAVYMVRSSSCEDSKSNPNAGGNESIAHVNFREIGSAIAGTIASYFSPKSLLQRSIDGEKLSRSIPPLSVVIQEMIGEDEAGIPVSGVIFTEYMVRGTILIQSSFGHGNGVVTADGSIGIDSYFCDEDDGVYAKCAHKPVRQVADPAHKFILKENTTEKSSSLSLCLEEIQTLKMVALRARELEGQELDLEFTCKNGVVYLLQMRPLAVQESKASFIRDEYLRPIRDVGILASSHMSVIPVESSRHVVKEKTLALALNYILSLPKEERERHSVVFSEEPAASTSHEATTFRMLGITAVQVPLAGDLPDSFLIDVQRSMLAERVGVEGIEEGYTAYPDRGPFNLELLESVEPRLAACEPMRFLDGRDLSDHLQEVLRTNDESYGYLVALHLGFFIERVKKYYPEKIEDVSNLIGLHRQLCKAVSREFRIGSRLLAKSAALILSEKLKTIEAHMKKYEPKSEEQTLEERKQYIYRNAICELFFDSQLEPIFAEMIERSSREELEEFFQIAERFQHEGIFSQWVFAIVGSFLREGNTCLADLISLSRMPERSSLSDLKYLKENSSKEAIIERIVRLSRISVDEYEIQPLSKIIYAKLLKNAVETWDLYIKQLKMRFPLDRRLNETIKKLLQVGYELNVQLVRNVPLVDKTAVVEYLRKFEIIKETLFSADFYPELYMPSRGFDVRGAIFLAATNLDRHLPSTYEDLFTLIHQNIVSLSNQIEFSDEKAVIPSQYKQIHYMLNPFLANSEYAKKWLLSRAKLISIGEVEGEFRMEFQLPQRNHSSKLCIYENKESLTIQLDFFSMEDRPRCQTILQGLPILFKKYGIRGTTAISPGGQVIECKAHFSKKTVDENRVVILLALYNVVLHIGMSDVSWISEERFLRYCREDRLQIIPIEHTVADEELSMTLRKYNSLLLKEFQRVSVNQSIVLFNLYRPSRRTSETKIEYSSLIFDTGLLISLEQINEEQVQLVCDFRKIAERFPLVDRQFFTSLKPLLDRMPNISIDLHSEEMTTILAIQIGKDALTVHEAANLIDTLLSLFGKIEIISRDMIDQDYGIAAVFFANKDELKRTSGFLEIKRSLNSKFHAEEGSDLQEYILDNPQLLFLIEPSTPLGYTRFIELVHRISNLNIRKLAIFYLLSSVSKLDREERGRVFSQIRIDCLADLRDFTKAKIGFSCFTEKKLEELMSQIFDQDDIADQFFILFRNLFSFELTESERISADIFINKLQFNTPNKVFKAITAGLDPKIIARGINIEIFAFFGGRFAKKRLEWESDYARELMVEHVPFFCENFIASGYKLECVRFFKEFFEWMAPEKRLRWLEYYIQQTSDINAAFFSVFTVGSKEELQRCFELIQRIGESNPGIYNNLEKFLQSPALDLISSEILELNAEIIRKMVFSESFHQYDFFIKYFNDDPVLFEQALRIILSGKEGPVLPIEWWASTEKTKEEVLEILYGELQVVDRSSSEYKEEIKGILEQVLIRKDRFAKALPVEFMEKLMQASEIFEFMVGKYPKLIARSTTLALLPDMLKFERFRREFLSILEEIPYE